jgi:hypothetical protein
MTKPLRYGPKVRFAAVRSSDPFDIFTAGYVMLRPEDNPRCPLSREEAIELEANQRQEIHDGEVT